MDTQPVATGTTAPAESSDEAVLTWLLDSDPALRWQVERDLVGAPAEVWEATRARVAEEGFGAQMLALQDPDGQWSSGAYFPAKGSAGAPDPGDDAQPWTATTWSLNALRSWGCPAEALGDTTDRLERNARWEYDDLPYWDGEVDACINAFTLANGLWLGRDMDALAQWFVDHAMDEGGWNCEWVEGSTRASVDSTINSLEGLLVYERATGGTAATRAARRAGEDYLLERRLLHRLSDDSPIVPWQTVFAHPPRSAYSALRVLDHFRAADEVAATRSLRGDDRLVEAIDLVRNKRKPDGTWHQDWRHGGKMWFEVDVPPGHPSPWLTFQALRVLRWWDGSMK